MGVKVVSSLRSGHQNAFSHQGLKNLDELASDMSNTVQNDKKRLGPLWVRNLSFLPAFARPRTEFSSVRQEEYLSLIEWYNHPGSLNRMAVSTVASRENWLSGRGSPGGSFPDGFLCNNSTHWGSWAVQGEIGTSLREPKSTTGVETPMLKLVVIFVHHRSAKCKY